MTRRQQALLESLETTIGDSWRATESFQLIYALLESMLSDRGPTPPDETITQKSLSVKQLQSDYQLELEKNKELADTCARLAAENHDLRTKVKMVSDVLARKAIDLSEMKESAKADAFGPDHWR